MARNQGFSLLELLLACSLGLLLTSVMAQALLSDQRIGARLAQQLRQRQLLLRAHQLIAVDIERGMAVAPVASPRCNLAGRLPWLQILSADGELTTYSLGDPPSPIWQGQVLMRCGLAYGLDGRIKPGGRVQNRVVLDGLQLSDQPWHGCRLPKGEMLHAVAVCWEPISGAVQWHLQMGLDGVITQRQGGALLQG